MSFFNSGWFGTLIGIVGILLSIYFYRKDKIGARLDYQMAELIILDHNNLALGMSVNYFDKPITRLVKTQIVIWNSGIKTIEGEKIVANDPLKLIFNSSEVLGCNVASTSREINKCAVYKEENKKNSLIFNFDFLDPKDGAVIDILHTGEEIFAKFTGNIKGMKNKIRNRGLSQFPITPKKAKLVRFLISLLIFIISALGTIVILYISEKSSGETIMDNKIPIGIGVGLGVSLLDNNLKILRRRKAPKNINRLYNAKE